jgi:hypothetical protein
MLTELPNLAKLRMDIDDPRDTKSRIENDEAMWPTPYTESVLPILTKLRRDMVDPKWKKSSAEQELPSCISP